jgi:hypothetical protein
VRDVARGVEHASARARSKMCVGQSFPHLGVNCHRHLQEWNIDSSARTRRRDCVFKRRRAFLGPWIMRGGDIALAAVTRTLPCVDSQQLCGPGAGNLEILNRCVCFAAEAARNPWH